MTVEPKGATKVDRPIFHIEWDAGTHDEDMEIVDKINRFAIDLIGAARGLSMWGTLRPGAGANQVTERMTVEDDSCQSVFLEEITQAVHAEEISELVWQALICAYLSHNGWRDVAEALFVKHGYTVEQIVSENGSDGNHSE